MNENGELQVGAIIGGKYRIDRVLGQGGMGIVYAATHLELDQRVALKFLLRAVAAHPEMVERFSREARAAVRIQSEHVARVLDVGTIDKQIPYIVMEYLEGEALDDLLEKQGRLAVPVAVDFVLQACQALAEAHALGIVHRDIKPGNLFRARRPGRALVKVLDFGICKVPLTVKNIGITSDTAMMGSPGYMSPEQIFGAATVDVRTDIWAIGAVLYQMLGGRPPFMSESLPSLIAAVAHLPHPPLATVAPDVPPGLSAVIDACLQKDPAHRPPNVGELATALAPFGPPGSADAASRIADVLGMRGMSDPVQQAVAAAGAGASTLAATPVQMAGSRPSANAANVANAGSSGGYGTDRTVSSPGMDASGSNPALGYAPRPIHVRETTLAPMTAPPSTRSSRRATIAVIASLVALLAVGAIVVRATLRPKGAGVVAAATAPPKTATASAAASSATDSPPVPSGSAASPAEPPILPPSVAEPAASSSAKAQGPRTRVKAHASATPSAAPAPICTLVSELDENGDKHFKQVCK